MNHFVYLSTLCEMYWLPCSFGFPKDKHVIIESLLGTLKLNMIHIQGGKGRVHIRLDETFFFFFF